MRCDRAAWPALVRGRAGFNNFGFPTLVLFPSALDA
jgi:hypothetical protein